MNTYLHNKLPTLNNHKRTTQLPIIGSCLRNTSKQKTKTTSDGALNYPVKGLSFKEIAKELQESNEDELIPLTARGLGVTPIFNKPEPQRLITPKIRHVKLRKGLPNEGLEKKENKCPEKKELIEINTPAEVNKIGRKYKLLDTHFERKCVWKSKNSKIHNNLLH